MLGVYGSLQRGVFTLEELNLDHRRGDDADPRRHRPDHRAAPRRHRPLDRRHDQPRHRDRRHPLRRRPGQRPALVGCSSSRSASPSGALNGLLISVLRLQPFLVTLATWSILSGVAMLILPTDGGSVPGWWIGFGYPAFLGLAVPVWLLAALFLFWLWFRATRLGLAIRATGSNEQLGLPLRRLAHPDQRRDLRPLRPLRRRRRALSHHPDRLRLADHRQATTSCPRSPPR